ncbi:MAG: sensor histidine kinase [Poseidonibacter sp.]
MKHIRRKNYQLSFILVFITVGVLLSILSVGIYYYHELKLRHAINQEQAIHEFSIKKERFEINYARFINVLDTLQNNQYFKEYLDSGNKLHKLEHIQKTFLVVTQSHPTIMQLRYIDNTGIERIRLDRPNVGGTVEEMKLEKLQDKSNRYYFTKTMEAKAGEYVVSKLDLNMEHNQIEVPYKPVLRISLPVFKDGDRKGITIINLFMDEIVKSITNSSAFHTYLFDQDNEIIYSNDSSTPSWTRYLDRNILLDFDELIYTEILFKSGSESIYLGMKPKQSILLTTFKWNEMVLLLLGFIIPAGFVLAYFVSKIPKKLFDELEERELVMIQQSRHAAMGEMLGAITHQWRQPLNVLNGTMFNLSDMYHSGDLTLEYFDKMQIIADKNIQHMSETITTFSNFFKPSKTSSFTLEEVTATLEDILLPSLSSKDILFDLDIEHNITINGSKNELLHVMINLVNNARDAIIEMDATHEQKSKSIEINAKKIQEKVIITIKDNGPGIAKNIQKHIFEANVTTKEDDKGSGFGLYISSMIMEKSFRGKLELMQSNNNGTTFIISIPVVS